LNVPKNSLKRHSNICRVEWIAQYVLLKLLEGYPLSSSEDKAPRYMMQMVTSILITYTPGDL